MGILLLVERKFQKAVKFIISERGGYVSKCVIEDFVGLGGNNMEFLLVMERKGR